MGDIKVRKLPDDVIHRLNYLADQKGLSREAYVRGYLETLAVIGDLKALDNKYQTMLSKVTEALKMNNTLLQKLDIKLQRIEAALHLDGDDLNMEWGSVGSWEK